MGLDNIRRNVAACDNICLVSRAGENRDEDLQAMRQRGWIVFQLYIRRSRMQRSLPLYEREAGNINLGRMQYGWDDVVTDLGAHAPLDSADLLLAWLHNRGIACTNGADLGRLAGFFHEELTKVENLDTPPAVRFGEPMELTVEQLLALNFTDGAHLCQRWA